MLLAVAQMLEIGELFARTDDEEEIFLRLSEGR